MNSRLGDAPRPESCADRARLRLSIVIQITLSAAVTYLKLWRAIGTRGTRVPEHRNMAIIALALGKFAEALKHRRDQLGFALRVMSPCIVRTARSLTEVCAI